MELQKLFDGADLYKERIVELRRDFHKHAEIAWTEFRTTSIIVKFLQEQGIPVKFGADVVNPEFLWSHPGPAVIAAQQKRAIEQGADPKLVEQMRGFPGAVAVIDSGRPGKTLALRFDIDCNDLNEAQDEKHRPFKEGFSSVNPGFMHGCGHDGHASIGMVTAAVLNQFREELTGKVKIIFQLGEEGDKGAQSMAETGILDDVDYIYAVHIAEGGSKDAPAFKAASRGMYATTKFDITIHGESAHAGQDPEKGHHAILAACMSILGMQSFLQNSKGHTRLNVGTIEGGTGRNVVPDRCFFRVETRGSDTDAEKELYDAAIRSVEAACNLYGCTYEKEIKGYASTVSYDEDFVQLIMRATKKVPEFTDVGETYNVTGGTDDFTYMIRKVQSHGGKGCYMILQTPEAAGHHNRYFDFDESCLIPGVKAFLAVTNELMELKG